MNITVPSVNRADGTTDYYQWGENCKRLLYSAEQCVDILNNHGAEHEQADRDMFWHAYGNVPALVQQVPVAAPAAVVAPVYDRCDLYPAEIKAKIDELAAAGFHDQVKMYDTLYAAWHRTVDAFRSGIPFVDDREVSPTGASAMGVVTWTVNHWGNQIPGSPKLDDTAVRKERAADKHWHDTNES